MKWRTEVDDFTQIISSHKLIDMTYKELQIVREALILYMASADVEMSERKIAEKMFKEVGW